jgi:hypothetical protein
MSLSVMSPLSRPSASTSAVPTPCSFMAFATADTVSVEAMHTGADDMMSRIFLVMGTSWDGLVRYPLRCCANSADQHG